MGGYYYPQDWGAAPGAGDRANDKIGPGQPTLADQAISTLMGATPVPQVGQAAQALQDFWRGNTGAGVQNLGLLGAALAPLFDLSRLSEVPDVPQVNLPRRGYVGETPDYVTRIADPENVARVNRTMEQGMPIGRQWYNTEPMRQSFLEQLGPEAGSAAYQRFMDLQAATSPRSTVPVQIKNASYLYSLAEQGQPLPGLELAPTASGGRVWKVADRSQLPPDYKQILPLHVMNANDVLEGGGWNVFDNPKPASYAQNFAGNQQPITADSHNLQLWGVGTKSGAPATEAGLAYPFTEELQQREAARYGMTPAQYQASAWIGGAGQTGVKSPIEPFMHSILARINHTAAARGETPQETLIKMISGERPLLAVGGAAALPGLFGDDVPDGARAAAPQ